MTDTDPAADPAVRVMLLVELVPLQPVPPTDQVYDAAPDTEGMVYTAVALGHGAVGRVILAGVAGAADGVSINEYTAPAPQVLLALTVIVPGPLPAVRDIVLVVLVPLHPVPDTVQVYEVAPVTAAAV